jgi:hypothetical protein
MATEAETAAMPLYLLHHLHEPSECEAAFAAWRGFESPLRHRPAASTCLAGGHYLLWQVEADSDHEATALLPAFVVARTEVVRVREIEIP